MALCKQGTLHLLPLPGFHRLDNSCGTEMNVFNPEDDVLKTSPHCNKCTVTRQTVFLLQAYPSSSRDDSLVLLAPVPKYFQGQSSHVLAGGKTINENEGHVFFAKNCHEESSNNSISHNAL